MLIDSVALPEIVAENKAIDWSFLQKEEKKAEVEKVGYATFNEIKQLNLQKTIELNAVTVKANSKKTYARFDITPTKVVEGKWILPTIDGSSMFFEQNIKVMAAKYFPYAKIAYYLDGNQIDKDVLTNLWNQLNIQKVDIYEGIDAAAFGADITINFREFSPYNRTSIMDNKGNYRLNACWL